MQLYEQQKIFLRQVVVRQDPGRAMDALESVLELHPELSNLCHGLAHEIGHAAYERYNFTEALAYENDLCGSGYVHGLVESHLDQAENIEEEIKNVCLPDAARCFHGIGHGLMYHSNNDLEWSLTLCESLDREFQQIACAEGVFMEHFDTDSRFHTSEFLDPADPYTACRNRSAVHEHVCALYAPRFYLRVHPKQYSDAFAWCRNDVPASPGGMCAKGIGSVAMKRNIQSPLVVEGICQSGTDEQIAQCIRGMASYYIVHFASSKKGAELCPKLEEEHRTVCEKTVQELMFAYPD